jgi:hypothetical protein
MVLEKNGGNQLDRSCENILQRIKRRKASWFGHILRRNCLLKPVIEGKIEGKWKWYKDGEEDVSSY